MPKCHLEALSIPSKLSVTRSTISSIPTFDPCHCGVRNKCHCVFENEIALCTVLLLSYFADAAIASSAFGIGPLSFLDHTSQIESSDPKEVYVYGENSTSCKAPWLFNSWAVQSITTLFLCCPSCTVQNLAMSRLQVLLPLAEGLLPTWYLYIRGRTSADE